MLTNLFTRAPTRATALAAALALGATLAVASPAGATIIERDSYEFTEVDNFDFCGINFDWTGEFSGDIKIREGKNRNAGAFFLQDRFSSVETFVNTENGEYFTIDHNGVFQELRARHVEGNIFEFVAHEVGQPFVLRDSDGNVLVRDRGAITYTVLFDTFGDDEPGGELLDFLDIRISGPHPGFTSSDEEVCAFLNDLVG